jgi:hypothetical protein
MNNKLSRAAYGKPKSASKGIINTGANVGVKIVQLVYLRPALYGYKAASKVKK